MLRAQVIGTQRWLAFVLSLILALATTAGFWAWQTPGTAGTPQSLVPSTLFTAVFVSWTIWWFFYLAIYLGVGSGVPLSDEAKMKKAVGTALVVGATAFSLWLVSNIAPTQVNLAVFPLHIGFVWLLLAQTLDVA